MKPSAWQPSIQASTQGSFGWLSTQAFRRLPGARAAAALGLALFLLALAGCGSSAVETPAAADDLRVELIPPAQGMAGDSLTAVVTDSGGKPITDAVVSLEGNMIHPGMVPVVGTPTGDDADGVVDGRYRVPFRFTMLGDWIVTVMVERAGGTSTQEIRMTVTEERVVGE